MHSALPLLLAAASISAAHALIPSHWLSFAMVARAMRWPARRAVAAVALAGGGHVAATCLLGFFVARAGMIVPEELERIGVPTALLLLGLWFLYPALRSQGNHRHVHLHIGRGHHPLTCGDAQPGSGATIGALVAGMTFSPCLDMMPVFLAASSHSWSVIALLSLLMAVVTVTLMCLLVLAALAGLDRVDLSRWSRAEPAIVGLVLIGLAIHGFLSK